jgi:transcriptional regulator with XRE-family HTH domain
MVGQNLRVLRERKGITQKTLAEAIDVKVAYISAMENGVRRPSVEQVAVFAKVLGCTTDEIILGTGLALELKQEREFFEKYRAATPEKREAARASLGGSEVRG